MIEYFKIIIQSFFEIDNDCQNNYSTQQEILNKLNKIQQLEITNQKLLEENIKIQNKNYSDYINVQNIITLLIVLILISSGFYFYNYYLFNTDMLESLKSLGILSKDLHSVDINSILSALQRLNEDSANLNKEEIKLLLEIKNILIKKGISNNPSLNRPLPDIVRPTKDGGIDWNDLW